MARHLWQDDIEQRIQIRAAKDGDPALTYNDLKQKFGVSPNIIKTALEKTVDEWKVILQTAMPRIKPRAPAPKPVAVKKAPIEPDGSVLARPESLPISSPAMDSSCQVPEWEYHAIIVRSRTQFNEVVYEQQGHDKSDWKLLAGKSFQDVLNSFGKEKWELSGMALLHHEAAAFTGMYELVFKRRKA